MSKRYSLERDFQAPLIKEIKQRYPGAWVLKNDEQYIQGVPDLTILYGPRWAVLECKRHFHSPYQPNQEAYLDDLNRMGFATMICPENKEEVLSFLDRHFGKDPIRLRGRRLEV